MTNNIKSILFVIGAVMIFTAQANRPDDKGQQHVARPAVSHTNQSRPQVQARPQVEKRPQVQDRPRLQVRQAPRQVVRRTAPIAQTHVFQPSETRQAPRVYAVPEAKSAQNNRLFHRQHHNHWQPRYNFYDNQYHFYPYVNIAATVELSTDCISISFDGQTYFYDGGTFYLQDPSGQYVAVAPPIGIIVNPIADGARQVVVEGQEYYRYKGVFYVQVSQGYQVVGPVQPDNS